MTEYVERSERARKLLYVVADCIERAPEAYDQGWWGLVSIEALSTLPRDTLGVPYTDADNLCGTACCIAGTTVLAAGGRLIFSDACAALHCTMPDDDHNEREYVSAKAKELLELDDDEADLLFDGDTEQRDDYVSMAAALRAIADGTPVHEAVTT